MPEPTSAIDLDLDTIDDTIYARYPEAMEIRKTLAVKIADRLGLYPEDGILDEILACIEDANLECLE